MINKIPIYKLRNLKLIGWKNVQNAVDCLYVNGYVKSGALIAINAEKMLIIEDNITVRSLIETAEFNYADGISIVRSLRKKYPNARCISRIAGIDLWQALMKCAGINDTPVFLVGGKSDILDKTVQKLRKIWKVNVVGSQDGYFKYEERQTLFKRIQDSNAKIITVAMGSPLQEILIRDCQTVYSDALYMGIGGTYDVFVGHVKRAPLSWQNIGMEWFYRLLLQPNRIIRNLYLFRYLFWYYTRRF